MDKNIEKIIMRKLRLKNAIDVKINERIRTFDGGKTHDDYEILLQIKFKNESKADSIKIELQFQSINDIIAWIIEE